MNISFSVRKAVPTFNPETQKMERFNRIPADKASKEDVLGASSLRVVAPSSEQEAAVAMVEALANQLSFEGEIKQGVWSDGNSWVTVGKNGSRDNQQAALAHLDKLLG